MRALTWHTVIKLGALLEVGQLGFLGGGQKHELECGSQDGSKESLFMQQNWYEQKY